LGSLQVSLIALVETAVAVTVVGDNSAASTIAGRTTSNAETRVRYTQRPVGIEISSRLFWGTYRPARCSSRRLNAVVQSVGRMKGPHRPRGLTAEIAPAPALRSARAPDHQESTGISLAGRQGPERAAKHSRATKRSSVTNSFGSRRGRSLMTTHDSARVQRIPLDPVQGGREADVRPFDAVRSAQHPRSPGEIRCSCADASARNVRGYGVRRAEPQWDYRGIECAPCQQVVSAEACRGGPEVVAVKILSKPCLRRSLYSYIERLIGRRHLDVCARSAGCGVG